MTSGAAFESPPSGAALTPRFVIEAWRSITLSEARATFLIGCGLFLATIARGIPLGAGYVGLPIILLAVQVEALVTLLAYVVADRWTGGNPHRKGPYAVAVLVGASIGSPVAVELAHYLLERFVREEAWQLPIGLYLYRIFDLLMIAGGTVWLILDRRRALHARARLHTAEQQRIVAERRSLESDLLALQARVEPRFLFNTLAQVRELFRSDASRGARLLDDLITYLRAAMPLMRDSSSTLGQEVELARAYLDVVRERTGGWLKVEFDIPLEARSAHMPPMLMMPMIDQAIDRWSGEVAGAVAIRVAAEVDEARLRLRIIDRCTHPPPVAGSEGIASLRERLDALFHGEASLELRRTAPDATEAVLDLPLDSAPAPEPDASAPQAA